MQYMQFCFHLVFFCFPDFLQHISATLAVKMKSIIFKNTMHNIKT